MTIPVATTAVTSSFGSPEAETPLLAKLTVDGAVDYKGRPAIRSNHGRWRSAFFIIGVEMGERIAYYGIASNLITYLTGSLGQSTATAAENINVWSGVASLLPLLGGLVADSFLGCYRTIIVSSLIYIMGLGLLTLSAIWPSLNSTKCHSTNQEASCSSQIQLIIFIFALYLVAIGQGGHKPCVQAFGADQFDGHDPEECKEKSSFFNWWYFGYCTALLLALPVLFYIQDNLNWAFGFGIPCLLMTAALVVFLFGSWTYRYNIRVQEKSPFMRFGQVFATAVRNWRTPPPALGDEEKDQRTLTNGSEQFRFLNKALLTPDNSKGGRACSVTEVEEAKAALRLFPIWATSFVYTIVFAQTSTFFTKQGATMDRSISNFVIPSASLQSFIGLFIVVFVPIYDRIIVPVAQSLTGNPSGITMLQRIGVGMFISIISMIVAALVESNRLKTASEHGLIDLPGATVPMSIWWLIPQYALCGIADAFTVVGLQEFFYDQVPNELRSVGLSLYLSIFGIGSLLSSFLVSIISEATSRGGKDGWFADNLNRAHLDYFYWLLAGLSALELALFIYFAKSYIYNRKIAAI
ncbi:hypothetical protein Ancab_038172 [Ancistrocladus abbreviatus]